MSSEPTQPGQYQDAVRSFVGSVKTIAVVERERDQLRDQLATLTSGPRLYLDPDGYGEPTVWVDDDKGTPQPVVRPSDLSVGQRSLWPVIVTRLTGSPS